MNREMKIRTFVRGALEEVDWLAPALHQDGENRHEPYSTLMRVP